MKRNVILGGLAVVIGLCSLTTVGLGDEGEKKATDKSTEHDAMAEAWMKASQPGPQHERLKEMVGKWKTEVKQWQGPGEPTVSYGTATFRMILGGRYLEETNIGESEGKPFEGHGILGYDNTKQKYVSTWIDNMSTGIMMMEGDYDEATKTSTSSGSFVAPGGVVMKMRMIERQINKDKCVFEMFMTGPDGHEMKNMELTYTRI